VQISAIPSQTQLTKMQQGVTTDSGILRAKRVSVLRQGEKNAWLEITLDEGRNRQIRRLLEVLELPVLRLIRVQIGALTLGELPKGQWRILTIHELALLNNA
jgi:23S rRNA pseudouridine2605 synthase